VKSGLGKGLVRIAVIVVVPLLMALVPRSAATFDADPFSRWLSNRVYYVLEPSIPSSWQESIGQAASLWSIGSANSYFEFVPSGQSEHWGSLTQDDTSIRCLREALACSLPSEGPGYPDPGGVMTVFDDDVNWTVTAPDNCGTQPPTINVKNISLHEFGHWLQLWDYPSGHPEAVMSWSCDNKDSLRQDDRDGVQYLYGTEVSTLVDNGGLAAELQIRDGEAPWVRVSGTANSQYWTARGKGQAAYALGPLYAGSSNRWRLDVDIILNSASGTGWSPQLYLADTSGNRVTVGWQRDEAAGFPNTTWLVQSSVGDTYFGDGSSDDGNHHHFTFIYNPTTKSVSWAVDSSTLWSGQIPFTYPYVLVQGRARAIGDSLDVTFKNFRITTEWSPN